MTKQRKFDIPIEESWIGDKEGAVPWKQKLSEVMMSLHFDLISEKVETQE